MLYVYTLPRQSIIAKHPILKEEIDIEYKNYRNLLSTLMKNTLILLNILKQIGIRGSVHTQTATLNVKLTFVGVRIKVPDIRVMAEMSKTNLKNTMCNNSNKKKEKTWFFSITVQKLATYIFNRTFSTLYF